MTTWNERHVRECMARGERPDWDYYSGLDLDDVLADDIDDPIDAAINGSEQFAARYLASRYE